MAAKRKVGLERVHIEALIFRTPTSTRFTQDSPVMPDVWIAFAKDPLGEQDLIVTPDLKAQPGKVAQNLIQRLGETLDARIAYNQTSVAANLTFDDLVVGVLPLSGWWRRLWLSVDSLAALEDRYRLYLRSEGRTGPDDQSLRLEGSFGLTLRIIHAIHWSRTVAQTKQPKELRPGEIYPSTAVLEKQVPLLMSLIQRAMGGEATDVVYSINRNRPVSLAVYKSVPTIKADAVSRLFATECRGIRWAIIDSGINAKHPAFKVRSGGKPTELRSNEDWSSTSRVIKTYDFTLIRKVLSSKATDRTVLTNRVRADLGRDGLRDLRAALKSGREVDWSLLTPFLEVHHDADYREPKLDHGTHVAGILGADWDFPDKSGTYPEVIQGVCPDIRLIDLRVFDGEPDGTEFAVMAAMQFLRHQNANKDVTFVHGANISLSLPHDVSNYACGRTPVCEECRRLVNAGIVVVAAAGNGGYLRYQTDKGFRDGYFSVSITDPGNADSVITVGSTHRFEPHNYGVSFFSSRGPTGDGRRKPDLVAPGEKIDSIVSSDLGVLVTMDGTSMAAPHVSGAAALLMARHRELAGEPDRIKEILCRTATDLGRERYFQGHGMVDVLRAVQSV